MQRTFDELLALLALDESGPDRFVGQSLYEKSARVFGGQVIAQALVAATRTVDAARAAHSLHAYFLRPGDTSAPILFEVERLRDGASFSTRRVMARQKDEAIFALSASYQIAQAGFSHQAPMPDVLPPEALDVTPELAQKFERSVPEHIAGWFGPRRPIEVRPALDRTAAGPHGIPAQSLWIKPNGAMGGGLALHQAVIAFVSDLGLLPTAGIPHRHAFGAHGVQWASLDHAIWFHRPFRADDWMLYVQESPNASNARGFSRGMIFTREGLLVASLAQEGLMRPVDAARPKS